MHNMCLYAQVLRMAVKSGGMLRVHMPLKRNILQGVWVWFFCLPKTALTQIQGIYLKLGMTVKFGIVTDMYYVIC